MIRISCHVPMASCTSLPGAHQVVPILTASFQGTDSVIAKALAKAKVDWWIMFMFKFDWVSTTRQY